jgi:tetratricopeptide (TPR) repeat protein
MTKNSNKNWSLLICLTLTLTLLVVFFQVRGFSFVTYDDPVYVSENPNIQTGFTLKAVEWAFTTGFAANWHPLTWLSLMLDRQLFGANPAGFHITNLILHIANTLLLFMVLKKMTGALWQSAFVAALFALHPLHVESVAWVSERKDVLIAFFWLLTMWAYAQYVKKPGAARYLLVLFIFALGLMAKPMLVTLPFVFLLLDYWPLERIGRFQWKIIYRLVLEKIPFIILSAASSVITFFVQQSGGAVPSSSVLPLKYRILNVFISYVKYTEKMFWPSRLTAFYPHPGREVSILYAVVSAVVLLTVTILIFRFAKKHRYLATGWFWYLGTLVPVIGLVQVGIHAMADRYTYIPLTGLFIIIAWGLSDLLRKWPYRKTVLWMSSTLVLIILMALTYFQTRYWKDSITLYQHAMAVTNDNFMGQSRAEEAIWYNSELCISPNCFEALSGLGSAYYKIGKIDEAIGCYKRAIEIESHDPNVYSNLGMALVAKGKFDQAISFYNKALQLAPDSINIHLNLGVALTSGGKLDEAAKEYDKILSIQPQNAVAHNDFGVVLYRLGKLDDAVAQFKQAVQINPEYTDAKNNLSAVLAEKQKSGNNAAESYKK